jgi:ectoine hydroxylase-related dioxygenase (phytanoyl-CoA dioxygenase family)
VPTGTGGLTADQREQWERDGSFRIDGFADASVGMAMLDDVVATVHAADAGADTQGALVLPEAQPGFSGARPEDRISKVFKLHRRPVFRSFVESPAVAALLVELLGPDVDVFLSQFIFKNPGAWGQPWHQDSFYFPFDPPRPVVGVWLAVTAATLENGCLHVLPGSQAGPIATHVPDRREGANYGYVEIVDHDMAGSTPVLMSPGDLLVFDSHLMHCSTDNESDTIRAAMVFHFCRAGTVDHTPDSPVNDFVPLLRAGTPVAPTQIA